MFPEHFDNEDKFWIKEQLDQLILDNRRKAANAYNEVYLENWNKYKGKIEQASMARRAANTRLRIYVLAVLNKGKIVQLKAI